MKKLVQFFCVSLTVLAAVSPVQALDWDTYVVGKDNDPNDAYVSPMRYRMGLAIDGNGTPHATASTLALKDLAFDGSQWVENAGIRWGRDATMAPVGNGNIVAAWWDTGNILRLREYDFDFDGTEQEKWQPVIDLGATNVDNLAAAVGPGMTAADTMIYGQSGGLPTLVYNDGTNWVYEAFGPFTSSSEWSTGSPGTSHSLRIDDSGQANALLYNGLHDEGDGVDGRLELWTRSAPNAWSSVAIPDSIDKDWGDQNFVPSAFDFYNGSAYVAWTGSDGKLAFSTNAGGAWSTEVLDENATTGDLRAIELDMEINENGRIAIAWSHTVADPDTMKVVTGDLAAGIWHGADEIVLGDTGQPASEEPLIAIDANNIAHVLLRATDDRQAGRYDVYHATAEIPAGFVLGDFDGNGAVNGLDIPDFKAALGDPDGWAAANPDSPHPDTLGDFDDNGAFNGLDIPGFKAALGGTAVPEPATALLLIAGVATAIRRRK